MHRIGCGLATPYVKLGLERTGEVLNASGGTGKFLLMLADHGIKGNSH